MAYFSAGGIKLSRENGWDDDEAGACRWALSIPGDNQTYRFPTLNELWRWWRAQANRPLRIERAVEEIIALYETGDARRREDIGQWAHHCMRGPSSSIFDDIERQTIFVLPRLPQGWRSGILRVAVMHWNQWLVCSAVSDRLRHYERERLERIPAESACVGTGRRERL